MTTRRSLIKTAAWVAPTALVSVAAPAVAASGMKNSLRIIGYSASFNKSHNILTVKVKVKNDSSDPVRNISVTISAGDARVVKDIEALEENRPSDQIEVKFDGYYPHVLTYVTAPGVHPITMEMKVSGNNE